VLKFEYDNARAARKKVATDWACKSSIFNFVWLVADIVHTWSTVPANRSYFMPLILDAFEWKPTIPSPAIFQILVPNVLLNANLVVNMLFLISLELARYIGSYY
jgi:hypothetical protein